MPSIESNVIKTTVNREAMLAIKDLLEATGERKFEVMEAAIHSLEEEKEQWKQKAEDMRAKAEQHWQEKEDIRKVNADIREEIKHIKDTHHSLHERHRKLSEENETWREVVKMLLDQ